MSTTFIVTLTLAVLAVAYWRVTVLILLAILLALLVTGVDTLAGAVGAVQEKPTVVAPAKPGAGPDVPPESSDHVSSIQAETQT